MAQDKSFFYDRYINGQRDQIYDYEPAIGATGDFKRLSGIDVVIRSIRTLLLTPLEHYPFDPEFGSLLYKKLFEMADDITQDEIEFEIEQRIPQFEDRATIDKVESQWANDKKTIKVDVHIDRLGVKGKVSVMLDPQRTMFGLEDKISESEV